MKGDPVDYATIREKFTDYKCENGLILHHKPVLTSVYIHNNLPSTLDIDQTHTTIIGKGWIPPTQARLTKEHEEKGRSLKWTNVQPAINMYETDVYILFLYPLITKIFLEEIADKNGNPKLSYISRTIVNVIDKSMFMKQENMDLYAKRPSTPDDTIHSK
ncbi:MAG: hypothetical protein MPK75_12035 [Alphaproteobacteria bacterium]|nr:hypothetical protein [Alphaproteobacteria bacterium]